MASSPKGSPKLSSPKLSPKLAGQGSPKLATATRSPRLAAQGSPKTLAPGSPKPSPKLSASKGPAAGKNAEAGSEAPVIKSAIPAREDNLTYELKHLAAFDITPLHAKTNIHEYTRDSVQLLLNQIFSLGNRKDSDEGPLVKLPENETSFKLPRCRPVPKVKEKTRWQKFMEERNMKKEKRSRLVWDENVGDWVPRWGKSSKKSMDADGQWAYEVKTGEDPLVDPFEKKTAEKSLLKMRQKMREVRNKVEALGGKMKAGTPDLSSWNKRGKEGLQEAQRRAQGSSASMGKFDRTAPNEKTNLQNKRRKVATQSTGDERDRLMKQATRVLESTGVDSAKAAKIGSQTPEIGRSQKQKKKGGGAGRRSKQGAAGKKGGKKNSKKNTGGGGD